MTQQGISQDTFKHRILVIDDEKRIRDGCHAVLIEEGFEVSVAENGEQGLEKIRHEYFDVILVDLMMPGISGLEVMAEVKTSHPDTAIIMITGYATVEHSIEAMKKGAFDFIPKPFSPDQLRVVVAKAIDYTRSLQDIATEKSRIRVLINHLADCVLATDGEKRTILANPAFLKMVGYSGENVIGRPVEELTQNEQILRMIDQTLVMPQDEFVVMSEETTPQGKGNGEETILNIQCIPFRDRRGHTLGTVTVLHDITALKKMDKLKSEFVSMVSHEIRSPMTAVQMQLKVVLDGLAGEVTPKQQEILGRASQKINGLVDLASELLDLAKIESGLITQEKELINMAAFLSDQVAFHKAKAQGKNIQLNLEPLPELPPVLANRRNMEEVFSNIITNAINYTPDHGTVTLSALAEGQYMCLKVTDTGFGIPPEDLERIFERFYRVKNEKTRQIIGTGLGLPIVKSIVEANNGQIKVKSEVDRGTTFIIYWPLTAE